MIEQIEKMVNEEMKKWCLEMAEEKGLGMVEAAWLNLPDTKIELDDSMKEWLTKAESLGYLPNDFEVKAAQTFYNDDWYISLRYRISNPIYNSQLSKKDLFFPQRNTLHKDFVMPLVKKEEEIRKRKYFEAKIKDLEKDLANNRSIINRQALDIRDTNNEIDRLKSILDINGIVYDDGEEE